MVFEGVHLKRVLIAPPATQDEARRIQSVELYEDGVIVRWLAPADTQEPLEIKDPARLREIQSRQEPVAMIPPGVIATASHSPEPLGSQVRLSDDVGTAYRWATHSGSGAGRWWRGEHRFSPAVPESARRLTVTFQGVATELAL